jgi:hypothetical protein
MRRLCVCLVALIATSCGVLPFGSSPAPTATVPAASPAAKPAAAASPSPSPVPATATAATAAPNPTNTAAPPAPSANTVYVGNTDGEGVYLRNSPAMDDKNTAYPDGTALTIIGDDVSGEGQTWKHVKAPDGTEGYVPAQYTTTTPG